MIKNKHNNNRSEFMLHASFNVYKFTTGIYYIAENIRENLISYKPNTCENRWELQKCSQGLQVHCSTYILYSSLQCV